MPIFLLKFTTKRSMCLFLPHHNLLRIIIIFPFYERWRDFQAGTERARVISYFYGITNNHGILIISDGGKSGFWRIFVNYFTKAAIMFLDFRADG